MTAELGSFALEKARAAGQQVSDDPLGYLIATSRRVGIGMLVTGVAMGAAGWYLKAASTTAMNNELNVMGNIGSIFSNIKAPTFQPAPTGTAPVLGENPMQDVQNFAGDAWQDIQAAGGDVAQIGAAMGTLAEDLAQGIIDVAKSVLAFVMHFPDILWNGLVWGIGGALADVLNWLFPYLIVFGILLIAISIAASTARWVWRVSVSDGLRASMAKFQTRVVARSEAFWDHVFGNYKHPATVPVAPEPVTPVTTSPPHIEAGTAAEARKTEAEGVGGAALAPAPDIAPSAPSPPEAPEPMLETPPAPPGAAAASVGQGSDAAEAPPSPPPPPGEVPTPSEATKSTNGTTEQTQDLLGGVPPPGWTEKDVHEYLKEAPPAPEPEELSGAELSARADEMLA